MIKVENLTFYYAEADKPALVDVNLDIEDGEFILITGPSGSGKSSLARCLNGLIPHFYGGRIKGKIDVQGKDVMKHSTKELAESIGMVFQDPENQLVTMDIEREIAFGLENLGYPRDVILKRVEESLDTAEIAHLRFKAPHELSGGEKQKVAIASVLALRPEVLALDEPTSELDPKGAEDVLRLIERLNDELGITVILIEHRLDRVAHWVDRMILMDEGRIIADGSPRELLANETIRKMGVGLPPIVELVQRLNNRGIEIEEMPLTVKEARFILNRLFINSNVAFFKKEVLKRDKEIINIENLWHVYPNGNIALKNVNLRIYDGEFLAIMGRNASGKTTLVKHLNGLLRPTKGRVRIYRKSIDKATVAELAKKVGYVFQNPNMHLFADTVEEEVSFVLKNLGYSKDEVSCRVDSVLERFHLTELRDQYSRNLSGGERQRIALASVIVAEPKILVLDEPTRGLEYRLKQELMTFLNEYRLSGNTVILVSHDVETVARHVDRVVLLSEGRILIDGPKRAVLSEALLFSPQINRLVQSFKKYNVPEDLLTVDDVLSVLP